MTVRRATAIRHVHFEDLGTFEPLLRERGFEIRYIDAATDDLRAINLGDSDLVFALGGPISVYEDALYPFINDELALIERRLAAGRPIVGICLGAQMIARALGARVYASGIKEIGWSPLTLTEAGRNGPLGRLAHTQVLNWHGDTFDLPVGATHLASTPLCRNQGFAYSAAALGLQFHLEADGRNFAHWLVGHAAEIAGAGLSVASLRADTAELAPACAARARLFLLEWLDQIDLAKAESSMRMRAAG